METLLLDIEPPFARVTLNRPNQRNAMNFAMMSEMIAAFDEIEANADVRAVVIRGAGGTFCSGGDVADMQSPEYSDDERFQRLAKMDIMLDRINHSGKVVIAAVEGAALGGGFGLACVSDIAIAAENAVFGMPEVRIGLAPALISPYVLQRIGLTTARRLMLTGVRFDAQRALDYGVVSEVVPPDKLDEALEALLTDLRGCSPSAIAACKALIFESYESPITQTVQYRARLLHIMLGSTDGQEGMTAFREKRAPKWANS